MKEILCLEKKILKNINLGVPLKGSKRVLMGQMPYYFFAHKNILFGIFAPGTVPRSSAFCLFSQRFQAKWEGGGGGVDRLSMNHFLGNYNILCIDY